LLGESSHFRPAQLPALVLLLEYANKLLDVYMFAGIGISEIELTSNKLISKLISRFWQ
jgi:hypothetical protein